MAFQSLANLEVTGVVGEETWLAILSPAQALPVTGQASSQLVGRVYIIHAAEGVYVGSTAQELKRRLGNHAWSHTIGADSTVVEVYEVHATLDVQASGRRSIRSAQAEALRAPEQTVLDQQRARGVQILNKRRAATPEKQTVWMDRHNVYLGKKITIPKSSIGIGLTTANTGLQLLDVYALYMEEKRSQYVWAPYLLEDEMGVFTLRNEDRGPFRINHYFKAYETGPLAGQKVQIEKNEFKALRLEAELLWGTLDWKGDWVPGILRRELPNIYVYPPDMT